MLIRHLFSNEDNIFLLRCLIFCPDCTFWKILLQLLCFSLLWNYSIMLFPLILHIIKFKICKLTAWLWPSVIVIIVISVEFPLSLSFHCWVGFPGVFQKIFVNIAKDGNRHKISLSFAVLKILDSYQVHIVLNTLSFSD